MQKTGKKKKSFSHLRKDTLASLLKICTDTDTETPPDDPDHQKEELLQDALARPLPKTTMEKNASTSQLDSIYELSGLEASVCIRELLLAPETDLAILHRIQRYGKGLVQNGANVDQQEVGGVIYHAAIAQSLVAHEQYTTKLPQTEWAAIAADLAKTKWLSTDLRKLFKQVGTIIKR